MGKTKTAFVSENKQEQKTSEEKYRERKARKEAQKAESQKVHISGLKGRQRIKMVSTEEPVLDDTKDTKENTKLKQPKTRGKKYLNAKSKIKKNEKYETTKAVKLLKEMSHSKFDETVEIHLVVKKTGALTQVEIPHQFAKAKKIEVANDKTLEKLAKNIIDFDILLATPEMMPKLAIYAKLLGPRGLMPNPKNGTIIKSIKDANKFSGNTITLKTERETPLVHIAIGKMSQPDKELVANIEAVIKALQKEKQIVRAFLKATMSPSVKLQLN